MAGKRLVDAARLFNAARNIASEHLRIRSHQFDAWSKTSAIVKAAKQQSDRVAVVTQASTSFAQSQQQASSDQQHWLRPATDEPIPRSSSVRGEYSDIIRAEPVGKDHHYEHSSSNATRDPVPDGVLDIRQRKASRYPTPDGTIQAYGPPIGTTGSNTASHNTPEQRDERTQGIGPEQEQRQTDTPDSGQDPESALKIPQKEAIPEQEKFPEGINTDVFHSPRVAELLGGKPRKDKARGVLDLHGTGTNAREKTKGADERDSDVHYAPGVAESSESPNAQEAAGDLSAPGSTAQVSDRSTEDFAKLASDIAKDTSASTSEPQSSSTANIQQPDAQYHMRESRVPSSRVGRLWQYGSLATSMAFGAVGEGFRRATGAGGGDGSLMLSEGNMERLVARLSRMRGAALKLGQMLSFQDSKMLPAPIAQVMQRVQDNADYMPASQRNRVLASNLGSDWRDLFASFEEVPLAAASIGQVHRAVLASDQRRVAVKIQYPGVATSISSDLNNLSILLAATKLLPKGMFLDKVIANARTELAWECDYKREAVSQERFRELLATDSEVFTVPAVVHEASGAEVLTAEEMTGTAVTKSSLHLTQEQADWIGSQILRLCLRELTEFKFMQTDPNWTNFLYNPKNNKLELLDYGAAREYPDKFINLYLRVLVAAAAGDRKTVRDLSVELGYLTGHESRTMVDAHVTSVVTLAEPFQETRNASDVYDFRDQTITDRVREQVPVMLRERLAPPPEETYSLHRKLSGAFLLLARLGSRVKCRELFVNAIDLWKGRESTA